MSRKKQLWCFVLQRPMDCPPSTPTLGSRSCGKPPSVCVKISFITGSVQTWAGCVHQDAADHRSIATSDSDPSGPCQHFPPGPPKNLLLVIQS